MQPTQSGIKKRRVEGRMGEAVVGEDFTVSAGNGMVPFSEGSATPGGGREMCWRAWAASFPSRDACHGIQMR